MQIQTKPQDAKKVMDAGIPKNMSHEQLAQLRAEWAAKAQERAESIAEHSRTPLVPSRALKVKLEQFGHLWQAYWLSGKQWQPLLASPSLFSSAMEQLDNWLEDEAFK